MQLVLCLNGPGGGGEGGRGVGGQGGMCPHFKMHAAKSPDHPVVLKCMGKVVMLCQECGNLHVRREMETCGQ